MRHPQNIVTALFSVFVLSVLFVVFMLFVVVVLFVFFVVVVIVVVVVRVVVFFLLPVDSRSSVRGSVQHLTNQRLMRLVLITSLRLAVICHTVIFVERCLSWLLCLRKRSWTFCYATPCRDTWTCDLRRKCKEARTSAEESRKPLRRFLPQADVVS